MPPARAARQRIVNNENDENAGTTRLTRAKAAALTIPEDATGAKKALQSKKSSTNFTNSTTAPTQRKRAALGDVSNVTKNESMDVKDGKKGLTAKAGLVSKAAQNGGIQKLGRTNSSRSILGAKDNNKKAAATDLKRPASGSGVMGTAAKKRHTGSTGSQVSTQEESAVSENMPPPTIQITGEIKNAVAPKPTVAEAKTVKPKQSVLSANAIQEAFEDNVADLDAEDRDDPLMVAEYVVEIFEYLKNLETTTKPNANYMDHQEHLEWHLRGVLVDWLIEVHTRFHLLPETLFLAINIIDRFLSNKVVLLDKLQLVGVTAMFIASKYEEVLSPHVQNFKHVADDGFSESEILSAERYILAALNYDLSYPNPMNFLRRISKADSYDPHTRTLGKYFLEISLIDHKFLPFDPSHIAAASMYLARLILERGPWDATLSHYAGYTEEEIQPVFRLMIAYLHGPVSHEAFFKKYASKKFMKASIVTRKWVKQYYPFHTQSIHAANDADNPLAAPNLKTR